MKYITKNFLKQLLSFLILTFATVLNYIVIRYTIGFIINWAGVEEQVGWKSILLILAALSAIVVVVEIITRRRGVEEKGREVVVACRTITLFTTIAFGGFVLLDRVMTDSPADAEAAFDTLRWLSLSMSLGIFNYLYERRRQREIAETVNALVVVAECSDMPSATQIAAKLEAKGIRLMIVERDSPIYIKGGDAPIQVQVSSKDLKAAKDIIAK